MKEIITWSLSIKVAGTYRRSPEYPTAEEACAKIAPFLKKFQQKYTNVTILRTVRYEKLEEAAK